MSAIRTERDAAAHIGRIVVARPEAANALSMDMVAALRDAFVAFAADDAIKVVLITAEGADLTRGFDPAQAEATYRNAPGGAVKKVPSQRARLAAHDGLWWGPDGLYTRILHCPKVTAGAGGLCLEVGLYLALCCDLVLADDTARFGNPRWHTSASTATSRCWVPRWASSAPRNCCCSARAGMPGRRWPEAWSTTWSMPRTWKAPRSTWPPIARR